MQTNDNRKVGPKNINNSYGGILRISPNEGVDMGFAEISRSQPTGAETYPGYGDSLGWVSDSNGVFSCLALGIDSMQVNGSVSILKDSSNVNEILLRIERGSILVDGGNVSINSVNGAGGTLDTENLSTDGTTSLKGIVRMELSNNMLGFNTGGYECGIQLSYPEQGAILIADELGNFKQADLRTIVKQMIQEEISGMKEDINDLRNQSFVRQDSVHSVREISAVTSYPAEPREGVFYLLQEQ